MRRLFHQIYVSLVLVASAGIGLTVYTNHDLLKPQLQAPLAERLEREAAFIARALPGKGDPRALQSALAAEAEALGLFVRLEDHEGRVLARTEGDLSVLHALAGDRSWLHTRAGLARSVPLADGRRMILRPRVDPGDVSYRLAAACLFLLLAIGCYPVARRLSSRLEELERGVRALGAGRLGARVDVRGRDEVARLATSFNWAAQRIESLVAAQRRLLATASHELRSPLTRVRMALELIRDEGGPAVVRHVADAASEIDELDDLVEDVLLASRLEATAVPLRQEAVDLVELVSVEAARVDAQVVSVPAAVFGERRMLRRLVRNLLENARLYGGGAAISACLEPVTGEPDAVRLRVEDRGPGVPPEDLERIFEPFYRSPRHAEKGGSGLGLALVRQIARHHGGSAVCRPRPAGGTVFEVVLRGLVTGPR